MTLSTHKAAAYLALFALIFAAAMAAAAPRAQADEVSDLTARVEETAVKLNEAQANLDDIQARIAENKDKIAELQVQIEENRASSNEAMCSMYRYHRSIPTLVQLVVSSSSVSELYGTVDYLTRCQESYLATLQEQADAKRDLEQTSEQLAVDEEQAKIAIDEAQKAMEEAQAAREEAMRRAAEEAARQMAEEQARQARAAAAQQQGQPANPAVTVAGGGEDAANESKSVSSEETVVIDSTISSSDVTWSARDEFVNGWAARIDNYLAGSPLYGYGRNFAEAAWDYGVDPRWSPAISCVESGKGAVCYRSYNAWGWGGINYGSWEESINAHVGGLSRGYGYSLTIEAAQKYCPPTYQSWYNRCLEEMNKI